MGLIKEPRNVDFSTQSMLWTEEVLCDFGKLLDLLKAKKAPNMSDVNIIKVEKDK